MGSITVSIVSHQNGDLLPGLLADLSACPEVDCVVVTQNVPDESLRLCESEWLTVIDNLHPRGFGENHNAAFQLVTTPYFLVLNPDVRLKDNPFPSLLCVLDDINVAVCAPAVINTDGVLEDSVRQFPSLLDLVLKLFGKYDGCIRYKLNDDAFEVPWLAGMFMLLRSCAFRDVSGFDERFFLYYEDVDLCARLWESGKKVSLQPKESVIHNAQRASHRDLMHMKWHIVSIIRYILKHRIFGPARNIFNRE